MKIKDLIKEEVQKMLEASMTKGFRKAVEALQDIQLKQQQLRKAFVAEKDPKKKEKYKQALIKMHKIVQKVELDFNRAISNEPVELEETLFESKMKINKNVYRDFDELEISQDNRVQFKKQGSNYLVRYVSSNSYMDDDIMKILPRTGETRFAGRYYYTYDDNLNPIKLNKSKFNKLLSAIDKGFKQHAKSFADFYANRQVADGVNELDVRKVHGDKRIENPKTGNKVKLRTALKGKKGSKVYQTAKKIYNRLKDGE